MSNDAVSLVVPCFNEADRIETESFERLFAIPRAHLLFVDDGSTDATAEVLAAYCRRRAGGAELLSLPENVGKGEAVRRGLLHVFPRSRYMGYLDADLSTPIDEIARLLEYLIAHDLDGVLGSRVATLGSTIERRAVRQAVGRVFATGASLVLRTRVYDTQCGAKLFRASDAIRSSIEAPFRSRWAFDVELIGRLMIQGVRLEEVPLRRWTHVRGSKLTLPQMLRAAADLLRIERSLRALRSAAARDQERAGDATGERER